MSETAEQQIRRLMQFRYSKWEVSIANPKFEIRKSPRGMEMRHRTSPGTIVPGATTEEA